ncbi:hypothetical protein CkaCkLH20_13151 [Colletotrichum karsti]|uniref:Zn(2)-C6 fungal-type domain-containing protein n=1 Tax=Colletotrichum karsti TaxID=1095194 RepID=A0A9P6HRY0_9PEZI|nr:uncharacterized protein CkaCkLH20_13151 [Colletotrichum karsti]KAF9869382.1 hypothetical protein CkaCkLH20_13151 [Colletotrichum karsti]
MPLPRRTRQACDRCHGQKLRCPKQAGSAICARCSKAHVPCVYSAAGPQTTPGHLIAEPPTPLDWDAFSFDHLLGPNAISQIDLSVAQEETSSSQITSQCLSDPRSQCFDKLATMMAKLNEAFNALPPVSKLHVPGPHLELFCLQVKDSYGLRQSLEIMLSQTQDLVDLYPNAIKLAVEHTKVPNCSIPDCVHTYQPQHDFGQDPFETTSRIDFTLLNQLVSCHYRIHDITELIFSHAQVCFSKFLVSEHHEGEGERHQFDIPDLRVGSFTLSPGSSPSVITAILVDLQSSLARCVPKLQSTIAGDPTTECRVIYLQCDMLKDRTESIIQRFLKLREAITKAGLIT